MSVLVQTTGQRLFSAPSPRAHWTGWGGCSDLDVGGEGGGHNGNVGVPRAGQGGRDLHAKRIEMWRARSLLRKVRNVAVVAGNKGQPVVSFRRSLCSVRDEAAASGTVAAVPAHSGQGNEVKGKDPDGSQDPSHPDYRETIYRSESGVLHRFGPPFLSLQCLAATGFVAYVQELYAIITGGITEVSSLASITTVVTTFLVTALPAVWVTEKKRAQVRRLDIVGGSSAELTKASTFTNLKYAYLLCLLPCTNLSRNRNILGRANLHAISASHELMRTKISERGEIPILVELAPNLPRMNLYLNLDRSDCQFNEEAAFRLLPNDDVQQMTAYEKQQMMAKVQKILRNPKAGGNLSPKMKRALAEEMQRRRKAR